MPVERVCMGQSEHRRASKPIMEKRRRARINNSLTELKSLILDATRKDCSRHSKLEKADILEMTVKHLQTLQRQQMAAAVSSDPTVLNKFKGGFSECASEVSRYLNTIDGVDKGVRQRILAHLATCLTGLHSYLTPLAFPHPHNFPSQNFPNNSPPHFHPHLQHNGNGMRSVPAGLLMQLPPRDQLPMQMRGGPQHFFPPSVSPMSSCYPLSEHNSCSSPTHSAPSTPNSITSSYSSSTPTTPLSPASSLCSSRMSESDPVWRPW